MISAWFLFCIISIIYQTIGLWLHGGNWILISSTFGRLNRSIGYFWCQCVLLTETIELENSHSGRDLILLATISPSSPNLITSYLSPPSPMSSTPYTPCTVKSPTPSTHVLMGFHWYISIVLTLEPKSQSRSAGFHVTQRHSQLYTVPRGVPTTLITHPLRTS